MSIPIIYRYVLGGNKIIFKTGGLTIFFLWLDGRRLICLKSKLALLNSMLILLKRKYYVFCKDLQAEWFCESRVEFLEIDSFSNALHHHHCIVSFTIILLLYIVMYISTRYHFLIFIYTLFILLLVSCLLYMNIKYRVCSKEKRCCWKAKWPTLFTPSISSHFNLPFLTTLFSTWKWTKWDKPYLDYFLTNKLYKKWVYNLFTF